MTLAGQYGKDSCFRTQTTSPACGHSKSSVIEAPELGLLALTDALIFEVEVIEAVTIGGLSALTGELIAPGPQTDVPNFEDPEWNWERDC